MGLIESLIRTLFGDKNVIAETAEVFRVNAEAEASREAEHRKKALEQFAAEFSQQKKNWWDAFIDGLNRLPRPFMAMGVIALFISAMVDPLWFGERMAGLALVPEPLWWLLGAIVSFYFGARHQAKGQEFQRQIAASLRPLHAAQQEKRNREKRDDAGVIAQSEFEENAALEEWRRAS